LLPAARRSKALLLEDVNSIRATNNAIFNDIFWVHLAYATAEDGIECLRARRFDADVRLVDAGLCPR
jgi:hypothetical protein